MCSQWQRCRNDQRVGGTYPTARAVSFSMYICIYLFLLIVKYYKGEGGGVLNCLKKCVTVCLKILKYQGKSLSYDNSRKTKYSPLKKVYRYYYQSFFSFPPFFLFFSSLSFFCYQKGIAYPPGQRAGGTYTPPPRSAKPV